MLVLAKCFLKERRERRLLPIPEGRDFRRRDSDDLNKVSFILESYEDFLAAKEAFPDLQASTWGGVGETALFGDLGVSQRYNQSP